MKRFYLFGFLALIACDSNTVKDTIGITRRAPDEFRVVARPPLTVPPEFNLRPPAKPGEVVPGTGADDQAKALITGSDTAVQSVSSSALHSTSDSQFLKRAGAEQADSNVRSVLMQEQAEQNPEDKSFLDGLRGIGASNEPVVNAEEETARLKKNKTEGKSAEEGETPMTSPKDTGPLGRLLGY